MEEKEPLQEGGIQEDIINEEDHVVTDAAGTPRNGTVPEDGDTQLTVIDSVGEGINIQIFVSWKDLQDMFCHTFGANISSLWPVEKFDSDPEPNDSPWE